MLAKLKLAIYGAIATVVAVLGVSLKVAISAARKARDETAKARQRAQGEKEAREHVEDVTEDTREVREDNNRLTIDERRQRLRDKDAIGPRDSE